MLQVTDLIHEHKGVAREALIEHLEELMDNALMEAIDNEEDIVKVHIYNNYQSYNYILEKKYNIDTDRVRRIKNETITMEMYQHVLKKIVEKYTEAGYPLSYEVNSINKNYIKFVGLKGLAFDSQES